MNFTLMRCFLLTSMIVTARANLVNSENAFDAQCTWNFASGYPCFNIDLVASVPRTTMNGSNKKLNDIWGWTDTSNNKEYAIVGKVDGTAFFDISQPQSPIYLGFLGAHDNKEGIYRDMKTYNNYVFIVADAFKHGMQIFDLTQLRNVVNAPVIFSETVHFDFGDVFGNVISRENGSTQRYSPFIEEALNKSSDGKVMDFGYAHNIAINENSGFAYLVGSNNCGGGLYMLNIANPLNPTYSGCVSNIGWISDVQCVIYDGPDTEYKNHEICFASYYEGLAIIDVSNKFAPAVLSNLQESYFRNIRQGWLTEDMGYFLMGDKNDGGNTKTLVVDVSNLNFIAVSFIYTAPFTANDGNQFVKGNYLYQANYHAGLHILDLSRIAQGELTGVAFFDTFVNNDNDNNEDGAWGVYPFFESGVLIVSSVSQGLFIVRPSWIDSGPSLPSPTRTPSSRPSARPSTQPSSKPSARPSTQPSKRPSARPSTTTIPSSRPSARPSTQPSMKPTSRPSSQPSKRPPVGTPSKRPSAPPSTSTMTSNRPSARPSTCVFNISIVVDRILKRFSQKNST